MHIRGVKYRSKTLEQHARTFAHGARTALDKMVGTAHHYGNNLYGALGQDAAAITRTVGKVKKDIASYEDLRRSLVGGRV